MATTSHNNNNYHNPQDELKRLKEAIIDLYLAIKIRSTEELDQISEGHLEHEKKRLVKKSDGFQIIDYIRSSIEIIMNLKVEDLEREINSRGMTGHNDREGRDSLNQSSTSSLTINPQSFVLASMKEALIAASSVKQHGSMTAYTQGGHKANSSSTAGAVGGGLIQEINDTLASRVQQHAGQADPTAATHETVSSQPPKEYEQMLQKLEADIRGHIRLEHEMKIHLDYLEGKVEELEGSNAKLSNDKKNFQKKMNSLEERQRDMQIAHQQELQELKAQIDKLHDNLKINEKKSKEQIDRLSKELELSQVQLLQSELPSNANSVLSHHPDNSFQIAGGLLSDKNIYQTISEGIQPTNKPNPFHGSRNNSNTHQNMNSMLQQTFLGDSKKQTQQLINLYGQGGQSFMINPQQHFLNLSGSVSLNSSKKTQQQQRPRHETSKERLLMGVTGQYQSGMSKGNFPPQSMNPYIMEAQQHQQSKKNLKKKSESIDYKKQQALSAAAQKLFRNSQHLAGEIIPTSSSFINQTSDDKQSWPVEESNNHHAYMNTDYALLPTNQSRNGGASSHQRSQQPPQASIPQHFQQQQQQYKVNQHNNTISIMSNNFMIPSAETVQLQSQKKKSQSSIRNSADLNFYSGIASIQKSHSISRPLSQLAKQQQPFMNKSLIGGGLQEKRSSSKLKGNNPLQQFFDLANPGGVNHTHNTTATVEQLIKAQNKLQKKKMNATGHHQQSFHSYCNNPLSQYQQNITTLSNNSRQ